MHTVAHALVRAVLAIVPTPVRTSVNAARRSAAQECAMSRSFPDIVQFAFKVGAVPRTGADALVGFLVWIELNELATGRVQGDPAQTRGLPHDFSSIPSLGKTKRHCAGVRAPHPC
jgi:hypothetical protein